VAATADRPRAVEQLEELWEEPRGIVSWLTTVDHKRIGVRYLVTATVFFVLAGIEALTMRTQLAVPRSELISPEAYNQLFTMHGVTMIFFFITPMFAGFGNYFVPLMIGARDMAFPRVNALSYLVYLAAGLFTYSSFLVGDAPKAGWFNYVPLASEEYTPGASIDFYTLGLTFLSISTTLGSANFIVTMFKLRAPGMSINRMPLFCWAVLVQAFSLIFALPALTAANLFLWLQRAFDFHFFDVDRGGDPVLWQHLFWIFAHPDVYIILLPALGIVSTVIPIFARRPMVVRSWLIASTVITGMIGFGVWVHHMFAVGLPQISLGFFAAASVIITVPSGIQVFAWIATLLRGRPELKTPLLYVIGFLVVFVVGGVTGVMFAAIPFDQQITDSYFVVAHFHYVLMGASVFPIFAGVFLWLPKVSGRMYHERLGQVGFWTVFVGFNLTFFPMHISGLLGMPRRIYTYPQGLGWDLYNLLATAGAFLLALGILAIVANVLWTLLRGVPAGGDPWQGDSLEWATTSPPPAYNFASIPLVRSTTPNWDRGDREQDGRRVEDEELQLVEGHQTMRSTLLEGEPDRPLHMPEPSLWPLLMTLALSLLFVGLITQWYLLAVLGGAAVAGVLAGWHRPKAELQDQ
jgi:cytochrome c oxidase subunit I+III